MPNSEVVVITGVSSGIGRVTAEKFVKRGCQVFGTVRSTTKAQAIPGVVLVEMDIRDEASVQYGIQAIIAQARRIDVLVNSAQRGFPGNSKKYPESTGARWRRQHDCRCRFGRVEDAPHA
ncbi:SDR family NAD(P)-dependent oxidoreductase [Collimonas fungivorans]|uniref:Putative short-chain alcohol dehydrogenase n=1 Tax=Collimonas fungivorans (strain Ter331) TaxID=1005048 RepID=G0ABT4_COLFT|nr:SDR family NAD(P)-dependent oxidoreductase [Collimonas fungivorans]AEK61890.1 putative short-chain alcohol dehydrogenase [Collimonas fungivorans Ter331]